MKKTVYKGTDVLYDDLYVCMFKVSVAKNAQKQGGTKNCVMMAKAWKIIYKGKEK